MSGVKVSRVDMEADTRRRLALVADLEEAHRQAQALHAHMENALADASEGLRSSFPEEIRRAEDWLNADKREISDIDMNTTASALQSGVSQSQADVARGRQVQEALTIALTQKADAIGRQMAQRLAAVEGALLERLELLKLWFGEVQTQVWQQQVEEARELLEQEQYPRSTSQLDRVGCELVEKADFAARQESKHQQRLYLLKGLRHVCAEMGFREIEAPHYEKRSDRGSALLYTVDTLDRGKISFYLTLDGIRTVSEIRDGLCAEEFDQVSSYLEDQFGITTEFRMENGEPLPRLKQHGEKDEPTGASQQRSAD